MTIEFTRFAWELGIDSDAELTIRARVIWRNQGWDAIDATVWRNGRRSRRLDPIVLSELQDENRCYWADQFAAAIG